jgi:NAD(P)-dependent dehydrogenase (short-subunit alcohol dehydrogenase family)
MKNQNSNLFSLVGKTALVTGSAGLLGRQHCEALAEAGANVVVTDTDLETCFQMAKALPTESLALKLDVTDPLSIKTALNDSLAVYKQIDILINNAAINDMVEHQQQAPLLQSFEEYSIIAWEKQLNVNITGVFLCCQIIGGSMASKRSGSIINIASSYALVAPNQTLYRDSQGKQQFIKNAAYPVTKAAVLSLTRYLAAYWGNQGVRVNALSPGGVENHQEDWFIKNYASRTPLNRMALPQDYHGAIIFLASDAALYMTGANLVVDGGWTIW